MLIASASYAPLAHFYPALCATLLQGSTHVRPEYQSALNASANLSIHPCLKFLHFPLLLMDPSASLRMTARGAAEAEASVSLVSVFHPLSFLFVPLLDRAGGDAGADGAGRDVFGDYGIGGDDGAAAYGDAGEDGYAVAYPHVVFYDDVGVFGQGALYGRKVGVAGGASGVDAVVVVGDVTLGAEEDVVSYFHQVGGSHVAPVAEGNIIADDDAGLKGLSAVFVHGLEPKLFTRREIFAKLHVFQADNAGRWMDIRASADAKAVV